MFRRFLIFVIISISMLLPKFYVLAQCAMCRTQIENNVSQGETTFAAGLNTGILYLFFTPYILIGILIFLWWRYSKYNETTQRSYSRFER